MNPPHFDAPDWTGRRVFVTGCTGTIGNWVVRDLLAAGAEVVGLVRDRVADCDLVRDGTIGRMRVVRGRVEDELRLRQAFAIHDIDAVFHLAGPPADAADRLATLARWFETVRSAARVAAPSATLVVPVTAAGSHRLTAVGRWPRTLLVPVPLRTPGPAAARLLVGAATTAAARPAERSAA
jgi:uncharacterized protein YbjT (DUF2867 family)